MMETICGSFEVIHLAMLLSNVKGEENNYLNEMFHVVGGGGESSGSEVPSQTA
jgi:hypothetical protein